MSSVHTNRIEDADMDAIFFLCSMYINIVCVCMRTSFAHALCAVFCSFARNLEGGDAHGTGRSTERDPEAATVDDKVINSVSSIGVFRRGSVDDRCIAIHRDAPHARKRGDRLPCGASAVGPCDADPAVNNTS